jgi:hypothetical protein
MTTFRPFLATLTVLTAVLACAEAEPVRVPGSGKGGAGAGGSSTTSHSGGKTTTTTDSSGGTTATTTSESGGTTTSESGGTTARGGSGTTTTNSSGGRTTTTTTGASGSTSVPTGSCAAATGELVVTHVPKTGNDIGATTSTTAAAGQTVPVSEIGVKFCFYIMATGAATVGPTTMKIYSGGIEKLTAAPYYVELNKAKVTVEQGTDGQYCLAVDVAALANGAQLTGDGAVKLDWVLDLTGITGGAMPDYTKPGQYIATRNGAVAGCAELKW